MIGENGYIRNLFFDKGWIGILVSLEKITGLAKEMRAIIVWLIRNTVIYYDNSEYNLKHNLTSVFV